MHNMEGFQYTTELYLNMGYYTIRFSSASQYMTTVVTEFGKFRYNSIPMSMCDLRYTPQDKVDELLGDIKGFKTYIDNILVLSDDRF